MAAEGVQEKLMDMVQNKQVDLLDSDNTPLLQNQINKQQSKPAGGDDDSMQEDLDEDDDANESVNVKLAQAQLQMGDQQYSEIRDKVVQIVRRDSLLKEAKNLKMTE